MKTMYLPLTALLAFVFLFQPTYGQENYVPGTVVTLRGDSLTGLINYRGWNKTPERIMYKKAQTDAAVVYSPHDISGFQVQDEVYIRGIVEVETSPSKLSDLTFESGFQLRTDTVFLRPLIQGTKSLYRYTDGVEKEHFYIQQNGTFTLLLHKLYMVDQGGQRNSTQNQKYKGQLAFYLQECASIQKSLTHSSYNEKSLRTLFLTYYACTNKEATVQKKVQKVTWKAGIVAGVSLSKIRFKSDFFPYLTTPDFPQSIAPAGGAFVQTILPGNLNKWSLYNELFFTTSHTQGNINEYTNENQYTRVHTRLGFPYLKVNTLLRFSYPIQRMQLYVQAGMSNGFLINETNFQRKEVKFYSTQYTEEKKALEDTRNYEQGYVLSTGIRFSHYLAEIRLEKGNGVSTYPALASPIRRIHFLVGYQF